MHKPTIIFAAIAGFALTAHPVQAVVRYVDPNSPGPVHNGSSWTNPYTNLQSALAVAVLGDHSWVADGTYLPTTTMDRTISFVVPQGVKIFGGFGGYFWNETSVNQRDILEHKTILSGNIGNAGT